MQTPRRKKEHTGICAVRKLLLPHTNMQTLTFSLRILWERGHVPSVFSHDPFRYLCTSACMWQGKHKGVYDNPQKWFYFVHTAILSGSWTYEHFSPLLHLPSVKTCTKWHTPTPLTGLPNLLKNMQYCFPLSLHLFLAYHTCLLLFSTIWLPKT